MVGKITLTGKKLATINTKPNVYRKAGAQLLGKEIVGNETHLRALKKGLQEWMPESGEVTLEMDLQPLVDQIDEKLK